MKEIELLQGSSEWLNWRKGMITASIAPIIMGDSPYRTKQQLWREMMDMEPPQVQNEAMRRGNELEPIVRNILIAKLGYDFIPMVFQSSRYEWLGCSVDGIYLFENEIVAVVEIKTAGKKDHEEALKNKVPKKYYAQLQTIMEVLDFNQIIYCSYHNDDLIIFDVSRDQSYIDEMIPKLKAFWDSLQNFEQPEGKYKQMESERCIELSSRWNSIQQLKKDLSKEEEEVRSALISLNGEESWTGGGLKVMKVSKKGSVDYSSITELQGVDLEKYRKPGTEYWRIEND